MSEEKLTQVFSANLNRMLRERDMSRSDLARALGVNPNSISDWCNGRVVPRTNKMRLLLDYFGCELSDLVTEKEEIKRQKDEMEMFIEMLRTRPECKILFSTMQSATKEDVEKAAKIIEALRK